MSDDIAIKVHNVSKDFVLPHEKVSSIKGLFTSAAKKRSRKSETQHALKDISFEIKKGEFFGIVGRNGSGKSTLLKILAGIYLPTSGNVQTHGKLVPFIELGVGFNPELTGRENVYLNGAMLGFSEKEVAAMYDEIVDFAELERFMDQKLKNYSSGMQVRLAFSMAIRAEADILLIDEVLAVGDADFQRKCFNYFQTLKGSNTTVIFISHNMNEVREYCDRALLINNSKVVDISDSDTIAKQYSRMFVEEISNSVDISKKSKRWGNKQITHLEVGLTNNVLKEEDMINIKTTAIAHKDLSGVIFGFTIKNASKQTILGTNNLYQNKSIKNVKKDQRIQLDWTIPNIFTDGAYTIDAAVSLENGEESDWWENAASFTVAKSSEHAPYLVSPNIDLTVYRK